MQEMSRFILWLRAAGLTSEEINNFLLYVSTGEAEYFPQYKSDDGNEN